MGQFVFAFFGLGLIELLVLGVLALFAGLVVGAVVLFRTKPPGGEG